MYDFWFYIPINPEPWAVGPLSLGKKNGKFFPRMGRNEQLYSYQEAVREFLREDGRDWPLIENDVQLGFIFWHRIEQWTNPDGKVNTKKSLDVTNMQKATEDALQGIILKNDRQVKAVYSKILDDGPEVIGGVAVWVKSLTQYGVPVKIPEEVELARQVHVEVDHAGPGDNDWPPSKMERF